MKKIIAVILSLLLIMPLSFAFADAETTVSDEAMIGLGIIRGDETGYRLTDNVKRSEFVALILRLMGMEDGVLGSNAAAHFSDVPPEHWAYSLIGTACELGLASGRSAELFAPDDNVSSSEAIKILVCALGYGDYAQSNGGYPDGYLFAAQRLGLLKHFSLQSAIITRHDVCNLFYNALEVPVVVMDGRIALNEDKTVLTEYLGFSVMKGTVTGTYEHPNGYVLDENEVCISGEIYTATSGVAARADEFLGGSVVCYYNEKDDDINIYHIASKVKVDELEINADDILPQTTLQTVYYEDEDGTVSSQQLAGDDLQIYYNGPLVQFDAMLPSLLTPSQGSIKLRDTDRDGVYDVAIVCAYTDYVLKLIDNDTLYDTYTNAPIDLWEYKDGLTVYKNGESAELDELEAGDILSVGESLDKTRLIIEASNKKIYGLVTVAGEDSYTVESDDGNIAEYRVAPSYTAALSKNIKGCDELKPGRAIYEIGIDVMGKIASVKISEEGSARKMYAYYINGESTFSKAEAELLTQANSFEIYEFEKRVRFGRTNGTVYSVTNESGDVVTATANKGGTQLVQYVLSTEGKIKELYLVDSTGNSNSDYFTKDVSQETMSFRENCFEQKYFVDDDTVVFFNYGDNKDIISAGKWNKYFSNGKSVAVDMYNAADGRPDVVVYHPTYFSLSSDSTIVLDYVNSPILFINRRYSAMSENGNVKTALEGYQNGELTTVFVSDDIMADSTQSALLKKGVAIQYATNSHLLERAEMAKEQEEMVTFSVVHDFRDNTAESGISWEYTDVKSDYAEISTMFGTITGADDVGFTMEVTYGLNTDEYFSTVHGGTSVLEYTSNNGFRKSSFLKIVAGKKAFVRQRYQNTRDVVLY